MPVQLGFLINKILSRKSWKSGRELLNLRVSVNIYHIYLKIKIYQIANKPL